VQLTLVATCADVPRRPESTPAGVRVVPAVPDLAPALGLLGWRAYGAEVLEVDGPDDVAQEMADAFTGSCGPLAPDASPVALDAATGLPVAAVLTVSAAPWPDVAGMPFLIDVMTDPEWRRRGLARYLVTTAVAALAGTGAGRVGLRVDSGSVAVWLYTQLGFQRWNAGSAELEPATSPHT